MCKSVTVVGVHETKLKKQFDLPHSIGYTSGKPNKEFSMYVFVYGSLKRGFPLASHLATSEFIGELAIDNYTLHSAGAFPYMVPCCNGTVLGELYSVSSAVLERLDRAEQEGTLYKRIVLGGYEGEDVFSYVAHEIHSVGFAEWKGQPEQEDIQEELFWAVVALLDEGTSYASWKNFRVLLDRDDLDDYIIEADARVCLDQAFWENI